MSKLNFNKNEQYLETVSDKGNICSFRGSSRKWVLFSTILNWIDDEDLKHFDHGWEDEDCGLSLFKDFDMNEETEYFEFVYDFDSEKIWTVNTQKEFMDILLEITNVIRKTVKQFEEAQKEYLIRVEKFNKDNNKDNVVVEL